MVSSFLGRAAPKQAFYNFRATKSVDRRIYVVQKRRPTVFESFNLGIIGSGFRQIMNINWKLLTPASFLSRTLKGDFYRHTRTSRLMRSNFSADIGIVLSKS